MPVSVSLPIVQSIDLPLERDLFLRTLLRHLAGALQEVVEPGSRYRRASRARRSTGADP